MDLSTATGSAVRCGTALCCAVILGFAPDAAAQTHLVVVHGIGGEAKFRDRFASLSASLIEAATNRYQIAADRVHYLAESDDTPGAQGRSTKENIEQVFAELASVAEPDARIFVFLIGHGSSLRGSPRFQIPGPDISAREFADLIAPFDTQDILFVVLASASGGFISELSGPRRIVVTATKSGFERNETIFPVHFVAALTGAGADSDRDERLSVLEAFEYARREVARVYTRDNRLQTEHALLDDNGDGEGSGEPADTALDGSAARLFFFTDRETVLATTGDPELARLLAEQQRLESAFATLQARKAVLDSAEYMKALEPLLLEMARVGRAIREREGNQP
jgi:hypothetical protein